MNRIVVVGGGASGLMAAAAAARMGGRVIIVERNRQAGRKLRATGNGRCNLTNTDQSLQRYHGGDAHFIQECMGAFGIDDTLELFARMGVEKRDRGGYIYPYSDQAASVAEALRMDAEHLGVKLALNTDVTAVEKRRGGFAVLTDGWEYECDSVILAAGGCAASETGSDGSGYTLAARLGHNVIQPVPALVQLHSGDPIFARLSGIRMEARVIIESKKKGCGWVRLAADRGELQFTAKGISGIPVFQVSRYAARAIDNGDAARATLDLMPDCAEGRLSALIERRARDGSYKTSTQLFTGFLPSKLTPCLLERARINSEKKGEEWSKGDCERFAHVMKEFVADISGTGGFAQAQATSGGVDLREVTPVTMESALARGLYFAGEILDVDGDCGGYNLQWAWSSGYLAGIHAAERRP